MKPLQEGERLPPTGVMFELFLRGNSHIWTIFTVIEDG